MSALQRALSISRKDVESYYAKPPLITWGLLFPVVLLLAVYLKDQQGYLAVCPGILAMTLLFGNTSMAAIVVTFEKRTGTLDRLLLAPLSMRTIVLGKALSAAAYGVCTALVLAVILGAALGMPLARPWAFVLGLALGAGIFSLFGLAAAVLVREVFEAMTLLNFFRFPLLFVSGVFMPLDTMPGWIYPVALASPLTHVVELLRWGLFGQSALGGPWIPFAACAAYLVAAWLLAVRLFQRRLIQT